jgi:hypothetical protein
LTIDRILMTTTETLLVPPLPFKDRYWVHFPGYFDDRSIRRVHRYLDEIEFARLHQQVHVFANTLPSNMQIQITDVQLSTLFGHSGGWA